MKEQTKLTYESQKSRNLFNYFEEHYEADESILPEYNLIIYCTNWYRDSWLNDDLKNQEQEPVCRPQEETLMFFLDKQRSTFIKMTIIFKDRNPFVFKQRMWFNVPFFFY